MDRNTVSSDLLLQRMLDVVEEARRYDADEVPPRCLIRGLARLVPGLRCEFVELDWTTCQVLIGQSTDEDNYDADLEPDPTWRLTRQHPNCHYLRSKALMEVVQLSDFVTTRQLHNLEVYQQVFRIIGAEHVMTVPLPAPPGRTRDFIFDRGPGSGFTDRERMMLTLLQPHLYQIYRDAAERRRIPARLTRRQLDVLRCVALGLSNDQIADRLVIAPGTVTKHLENIYARLGVTSRTAALARMFNDTDIKPTLIAP